MPLLNYTTKVDIFTTLGQIQGMLVKHSAKKILQEYDDNGQVEAQMAILESEMVTLDEIFLPYMIDKSGRTVYQLFATNVLLLDAPQDQRR